MTFRNLPEVLQWQTNRLGPRPALRYKRRGLYHDFSWQAYAEAVAACAAALVRAGIQPGDRVGLLAENRLEWLIADLAIMAAAAVNVPPHAPLTARQVQYQLADAGVHWLFVSTREQLQKILDVLDELPCLEGVVVFDRLPDLPGRIRCLSWDAFLQSGRLAHRNEELAKRRTDLGPDDLATIMYTSGTTGLPKGVMLTHNNILSNVIAVKEVAPYEPEDVQLVWLPFSHIYARTVDHYLTLYAGHTLVLAESAETVVVNLGEIRPTTMHGVPRFYEKLLGAVKAGDPQETGRRLRGIFGPRIRWLGAGGAPLPLAVAQAFQEGGILLLQGYGLTETAPVISFNRLTKYKLETVGPPIPGIEVKIAADGEVLTRGPHVMKGYWNDPQGTAEAIRDGWFHTGDLGAIDADGFLKITGRKKELMVLSNGKKVVPNFIEGLLLGDSCIDQAVVCGEGRNFLTALVVPNWANLRAALRAEGRALEGAEDTLAGDPTIRAWLQARIDRTLCDVARWEQVRKILILPRPFSVAAEELTVSLKLRRSVIVAKYATQLEAFYQGEEPADTD